MKVGDYIHSGGKQLFQLRRFAAKKILTATS
jgi:hypothetical protein